MRILIIGEDGVLAELMRQQLKDTHDVIGIVHDCEQLDAELLLVRFERRGFEVAIAMHGHHGAELQLVREYGPTIGLVMYATHPDPSRCPSGSIMLQKPADAEEIHKAITDAIRATAT